MVLRKYLIIFRGLDIIRKQFKNDDFGVIKEMSIWVINYCCANNQGCIYESMSRDDTNLDSNMCHAVV